jgi:hypothetical protein
MIYYHGDKKYPRQVGIGLKWFMGSAPQTQFLPRLSRKGLNVLKLTLARPPSISGLKSRVLKLTFLT